VVESDGTMATVKMDGDFKVTGIETGPAGGLRSAGPQQAPSAG
jgi:N-methylhydantoinase A/oxoprolinase/acetone carboxylase beta subunit